MHNLLLRYWLASGGIDPDRDVSVTVIPPAQMVSNLKAGTIDGYCVGEPWNARAVSEGLGVVMATDNDIWPGHIEKVLGVTEAWAEQYPQNPRGPGQSPARSLRILRRLAATAKKSPTCSAARVRWGRRSATFARALLTPTIGTERPEQVLNYIQFFGKANYPDVSRRCG